MLSTFFIHWSIFSKDSDAAEYFKGIADLADDGDPN